MYHMKNIVSVQEQLFLPKCMYHLKNPIEDCLTNDVEINISDQVIKFLKKMPNPQLIELEDRQDKLLLKLDILYERIKYISSLCKINKEVEVRTITNFVIPEEVVIFLNANNLPYFLNKFLKEQPLINTTWHIHSSVSLDTKLRIEAFLKKYQCLYRNKGSKINFRLIFKSETTTPELKITSLAVPLLGGVNIIRYLCLTYDNIVPYDYFNHEVDALLDIAYELESTTSEKKRALLISKIFMEANQWIYKNSFSIVDLTVFNIVNQMKNGHKYVPKLWFNNCEKLIN